MGEYTSNTIVETFLEYDLPDRLTLVLAFQEVMARVLRMVGSIVEGAMEEERNNRRAEGDDEEGDGAYANRGRYALEMMTKAARAANTKLLHWRATDSRSGKCLGPRANRPPPSMVPCMVWSHRAVSFPRTLAP